MNRTHKLSRRLRIAVIAVLASAALVASTALPAHAVGPPGRWGSALYNNSGVGLGIVTNLGDGYAYVQPGWSWTPWNMRGGYTGWGYCTNVYYDVGNGWEYRFQIRGGKFWSVAYWIAAYVRADSWRC